MARLGQARAFGRRFVRTFFQKFWDFLAAQIIVGAVITLTILASQIHRGIIAKHAIRLNWMAVFTPYAYVLVAVIVWHFVRTAYLLHVEDQELHATNRTVIDSLQTRAQAAEDALLQVKPKITSKEWKDLATEAEQRCASFRVDRHWSKKMPEVWDMKGGPQSQICEALCRQAGNILLRSANVSAQLSEIVKNEPDPFKRWMRFMNEHHSFEMSDWYGIEVVEGESINHYSSSTRDLRFDFVRLCQQCASLEI